MNVEEENIEKIYRRGEKGKGKRPRNAPKTIPSQKAIAITYTHSRRLAAKPMAFGVCAN